ncbi:hypothetical protein [Streptomyces sp. AC495_CC817]|uniref:hypothetical protein n=1 Tax=Streptomyces sp. AC495_CC817 TaxID=2823900 RepID=UPI001C25932A|nr:hypothetical protein [Streptomyces sp. AC495_CC817]
MIPTGILLPQEWMQTDWFGVLATFVAVNTLIYVVLGLIKIIPKFGLRRTYTGASRRSETRSIHPDAPL